MKTKLFLLISVFLIMIQFTAFSQSNTDNAVTRYLQQSGEVLFSPDDKLLAINQSEGMISVLDLTNDKLVFVDTLPYFSGGMFSPDSKRILLHYTDTIFEFYDIYKMYDAITGKYLYNIKFQKEVDTIKFYKSCLSQDWKKMVTLDLNEDALYIWDLADSILKLNKIIKVPGKEINEVRISPDSKYLFIVTIDGFIKVWDIKTTELISSFKINSTFYLVGNFDTINKRLIIIQDYAWFLDRGVRHIYDIKNGKELYSLNLTFDESVVNLKFTDDGKYIYALIFNSGISSLRIWNSETGQLIKSSLDDSLDFDNIIARGDKFFTTVTKKSTKEGFLITWDLKTLQPLYKVKNIFMVDTGISSDGNRLLCWYKSQTLLLNANNGSFIKPLKY
jgi:WD40 repeat protein